MHHVSCGASPGFGVVRYLLEGADLRFADVVSGSHSAHPWLGVCAGAVHLGLAALCAAAWARARRQGRGWTWGVVTLCQMLLAADGFLAVRLVIAEVGREVIKQEGWYAEHRVFQGVLTGAVLIGVSGVGWAWIRWGARGGPGSRVAVVGTLASLVPFVMACVSMHVMEDMMGWPGGIWGLGTVLRGTGCLLTGVGVARSFTRTRRGTEMRQEGNSQGRM